MPSSAPQYPDPHSDEPGATQGSLTGLKTAGIARCLFELAALSNLEFKVLATDSKLIRETVRFEVRGKQRDLHVFNTRARESFADYQSHSPFESGRAEKAAGSLLGKLFG